MADEFVIGSLEAGMLKDQIKTGSIVMLSIQRTTVDYEDGGKACDAVEVTFGVGQRMDPHFTITQTVPLPQRTAQSPLEYILKDVVVVARETLKQRLEHLAFLLSSPNAPQI